MSHSSSDHHDDGHKHTRAECATFVGFGPNWFGLVLLFAVIAFSCAYAIMNMLFSIENLWFTMVVFFLFFAGTTKLFFTSPGAFEAQLLLNNLNGRMRAVFSGLNVTLPWETVEDPIDSKADIQADIPQLFSTKDGEVKGTLSIRAKPNLGKPTDDPRVRSEHAIRYSSSTDAAKAEMIEATCLDKVRAYINDKTTDQAVLIDDIHSVLKEQLKKIEKELSIDILECVLKDLDFSDETKKSKNSDFKGSVLRKMIKDLMGEEFGYTKEQAKDIVLVTMEGVRQNKEVKEFNLAGIPPVLEKFLGEFLAKHFDKPSKTAE